MAEKSMGRRLRLAAGVTCEFAALTTKPTKETCARLRASTSKMRRRATSRWQQRFVRHRPVHRDERVDP
jgi:hypothetical protein